MDKMEPSRVAVARPGLPSRLSVALVASVAACVMILPIRVAGLATEPSGIKIDRTEGGYTGMVFRIKEEVPEEHCAEIIQNLRVGHLS